MVNDLGYQSIALPVSKKGYKKILNNKKKIFALRYFVMAMV